ncbi:MAG TPA: tetratricopeptide repeat protein, partial [Polyangiaceae bacterium]|nr:tetratricopeptide repeat protein [Polyangiaceae bacterium]
MKAEAAKSSSAPQGTPSPKSNPAPQSGPSPQNSGHSENKAASEKARKLFVDAQAAFAAGEYQKAIDLFRRADAVNPRPELEYNIGLAYDQMGDSASALAAYRSYLRRSPDTAD